MNTQIRNTPHAMAQLMWLQDSTLTVEYNDPSGRLASANMWFFVEKPGWVKPHSYRLVKKSPTVTKYHVAYVNPGNGSWTVTYNAAYTSVEDFYIRNESLRGTKAELIQASAVQSKETVEIVFVSPAE